MEEEELEERRRRRKEKQKQGKMKEEVEAPLSPPMNFFFFGWGGVTEAFLDAGLIVISLC